MAGFQRKEVLQVPVSVSPTCHVATLESVEPKTWARETQMGPEAPVLGGPMRKFEVHFEAGISGSKDVAEAQLDSVMEYLVDNLVHDPWIGLGPDKVEITLSIDSDGPESALADATQLVLSAIRASSGVAASKDLPDIGFELRKAELIA